MNDIVNRVWSKTIASEIPTEPIEITYNDIKYMWSIIKKISKKDAIINDTWLENTTENPIDAIINFYNWQKRKEEHETNNK